MVDLSPYIASASKIFLAPNTSDEEIVDRAKKTLAENGIQQDRLEVNYDMQLLDRGDLFISYDPPDLVVRVVYEKKPSGMLKMKSTAVIKL